MAKVNDRAAFDKIVRARTSLLVSNGFFGFLALHLGLKEAESVPTMCVDGKNIYYGPEFTNKLSDRECEGVVAHEVMHCCFQHFGRRGSRDPERWNVAGDYVINADLLKCGFTLPKPHLYDPKYDGMSTEEVYDRLPKDLSECFPKGGGSNEGKADGQKTFDPGACGGVMDAPNGAQGQDDMKTTWEQAVRAAVAVEAGRNAGNIPGSLQKLIKDLNKPKVSWRDLTRRFIDQSMSKDVSWARLSRRSVATGTLMPGYVSDSLRHLVMFIDDSGSTMHAQKQFISEVAGALDEGTCDQLTIVYADTRVHTVDEYQRGDIVVPRETANGGTAFSDSFRWLRENAPDASCCIYLTDLEVSDFGEDPGIPTLWAVYNSTQAYEQLAPNIPFGECVHMSNEYN